MYLHNSIIIVECCFVGESLLVLIKSVIRLSRIFHIFIDYESGSFNWEIVGINWKIHGAQHRGHFRTMLIMESGHIAHSSDRTPSNN